jgi:hypothetical protein
MRSVIGVTLATLVLLSSVGVQAQLSQPAAGVPAPPAVVPATPVAAASRVPVLLSFEEATGGPVAISGVLVVTMTGSPHPPLRVELSSAKSTTLSIERGFSVELQLEAPGFWAFHEQLNIRSSEPERAHVLRVWRTGSIRGRLQGLTLSESQLPDLIAQILPPFKQPLRRQEPAGRVRCQLERTGAFRCEVPAGRYDLALRAADAVPAYRFGVDVAGGGQVDLGRVALRQGGSIAGFVESQTESLTPSQSSPRDAGSRPRPWGHGLSSRRVGGGSGSQRPRILPSRRALAGALPGFGRAAWSCPSRGWTGAGSSRKRASVGRAVGSLVAGCVARASAAGP